MATNPSIILGFRPGELDNPVDIAGKALNLRAAAQGNILRGAQLEGLTQENQQRARAMAGQAAVAEAVKKAFKQPAAGPAPATIGGAMAPEAGAAPGAPAPIPHNPNGIGPGPGMPAFGTPGIDYDEVQTDLLKGGYLAEAQGIAAKRLEWQKDAMATEKDRLDTSSKKVQRLSSLAGSVNDAATLDYAIGQALRDGQDPETMLKLQKMQARGYTQETADELDQFIGMSLTAQQQIEAHKSDLDYNQKIADFSHKVAMEAPKVHQDWIDLGSRLFDENMDADHFQAGLQTLAKMGAPQSVQDAFAQAGSAGAADLGTTAAQRSTAAHQVVLEAQGQERNDIARTRASVSRGTETAAQVQAQIDRAERLQETYQTREQALWSQQGTLKRILATVKDATNAAAPKPEEGYIDPKYPSATTPMTPQRRAELQERVKATEAEIGTLQRQQRNIREKMKWGDAAPKGEGATQQQSLVGEKPKPPAAAAAKSFPRARLAEFAATKKMTTQQAEAALKQNGYTIQ